MQYLSFETDDYSGELDLPDDLPGDPMPLIEAWLEDAFQRKDKPNPNAVALATVNDKGAPSVRMVLAKQIAADPGYVVFFTNYQSQKARDLDANPHAAATFHWDTLERQVRIEGVVTKSPPDESDAYFNSRKLDRRLGAWASDQSQPIESRDAMLEKVAETAIRFGALEHLDDLANPEAAAKIDVPRPDHWGGYRIHLTAVELWHGGPGRIHDRARWTRDVTVNTNDNITYGHWSNTRLQP